MQKNLLLQDFITAVTPQHMPLENMAAAKHGRREGTQSDAQGANGAIDRMVELRIREWQIRERRRHFHGY